MMVQLLQWNHPFLQHRAVEALQLNRAPSFASAAARSRLISRPPESYDVSCPCMTAIRSTESFAASASK